VAVDPAVDGRLSFHLEGVDPGPSGSGRLLCSLDGQLEGAAGRYRWQGESCQLDFQFQQRTLVVTAVTAVSAGCSDACLEGRASWRLRKTQELSRKQLVEAIERAACDGDLVRARALRPATSMVTPADLLLSAARCASPELVDEALAQ